MNIDVPTPEEIEQATREAVRFFWMTRGSQLSRSPQQNGNRNAVTGGKQLDGFLHVIKDILVRVGVNEEGIFISSFVELPGFYRPTKQWDLVVVKADEYGRKTLIAALELKSQVGSFGNNFNNRTEEAMGSSLDIWTAYRDGAFGIVRAPWLGYLMIIEDSVMSNRKVRVNEPHFNVFPEFKETSYADRYRIFCEKLLLERNYTAACFLMSNAEYGKEGDYSEPAPNLSMFSFINSLIGHILADR